MGRLVLLVSIATEVAIAHVVDENQDEVGFRRGCLQKATEQQKGEQTEEGESFLHRMGFS